MGVILINTGNMDLFISYCLQLSYQLLLFNEKFYETQ